MQGGFKSADGQPAIVYLAKEHRAIYFWDKTENVRVLIGSSKPEEVITQMRSLWAGELLRNSLRDCLKSSSPGLPR